MVVQGARKMFNWWIFFYYYCKLELVLNLKKEVITLKIGFIV